MHTVNSTSNGYQVGQWLRWEADSELHFDIVETFDNKMGAYRFCNYMNGGEGKPYSLEPAKEYLRVA